MAAQKEVPTPEIPGNTVGDAISLMVQMLQEMRKGEAKADPRVEALTAGVEALVTAQNSRTRENQFSQEISVFNPQGDVKFPRPDLICKMYWVGYELDKRVLTRAELEHLNASKPGNYFVTKADGRRIPFAITDKMDAAGKLEKRTFHFPCKNTEDRPNHMSMLSYLREAAGDISPSVERLMEQVAALQAELAASKRAAAAPTGD